MVLAIFELVHTKDIWKCSGELQLIFANCRESLSRENKVSIIMNNKLYRLYEYPLPILELANNLEIDNS